MMTARATTTTARRVRLLRLLYQVIPISARLAGM